MAVVVVFRYRIRMIRLTRAQSWAFSLVSLLVFFAVIMGILNIRSQVEKKTRSEAPSGTTTPDK